MISNTARPPRRWRFTATVLAPVLIGLLTTAIGTLVFVLWSAQSVDRHSLDQQVALARHVIQSQLARIPHDQQSVTVWDDAIVHAKQKFDAGWLDANLGVWMHSFFGHDVVMVVDDANRPIYAMEDERPLDLRTAQTELDDLKPLVAELRRKIAAGNLAAYDTGAAADPPHAADMIAMAGRPALASVAPIVSDTGDIKQPTGTEYLLISAVFLNGAYANRLSDEYLIPDLRFTSVASAAPGRAEIPLTNADGRFITFFEWTQSSPGAVMINQTAPAIAAAFLVAGITAFILLDQLWRKAAALDLGRVEAEHKANHDPLTGLPNRLSFERALSHALTHRPARDQKTSLLMLDLDRFKQVNDTLGHSAGDVLIQAVGQRLTQLLRQNEVLARLGGDEFGIIHAHAPGLVEPHMLSRRIIDALSKPFDIFGSEAFIGVSIGIATCEGPETDARELARKADIALYEAKVTGRNRAVVFEETMNELLQNRRTIEAELREALRSPGQLSVAFQPLYTRDRRAIGAEALARWTHPKLGQVSPAIFVPVAEATGLIEALGAFVLRQACDIGACWPGCVFAVNISPAQLRNATFPEQVFSMLRATGMRPADLELEITENILLEESSQSAEALRLFRSAGIRIALDDFGTGYSSLNYLSRYPVDRIKIDRSFVSKLTHGSAPAAIVQAMISLAHALNIEVTAEGVETSEQMAILSELGANVFQGFLLSPPVAATAIDAELQRHSPVARSRVA